MWLQAFAQQDFSFKTALYEGTIGAFLFSDSNINWVLWTMTIELMGSFVLFFTGTLPVETRCILARFSVGTRTRLYVAWTRLLMGIASFVIGIYIYLYAKQLSACFAVLLLILGLYLAGAHNTSQAYSWLYALWGEHTYDFSNFLAGPIIVYSVLMSPLLSKGLDRPILVWLGKLSFSIYLIHLLMLTLVCIPLFNLFLKWHWSYSQSAICSGVLAILATLVLLQIFIVVILINLQLISVKK